MIHKLFTLALLCCSLWAQENIAVLDLEADGVTPSEAKTLTNKLRGELIRTGQFTVLERGQMDNILKEQGFQNTGCTSQECAVEVGQLLGVKSMVAGSIGKVGSIYLISLRMIDVAKGNILKNVEEEVQGSVELVLQIGLPNAARKMAGLETETVTAPLPSPAPEPVPEPQPETLGFNSMNRGRQMTAAPDGLEQTALEKRKAVDAYMKARTRHTLSITYGSSGMESDTFHFWAPDSFNFAYKNIKWASGTHFGIHFAPVRYYGNPTGHSFMFGCEMGVNYDINSTKSSEVGVYDSLNTLMGNVTFADSSMEIKRFGMFDNIVLGYWIDLKPFAIEPYTGIGGAFDLDFITGAAVRKMDLSTIGLRFGYPLGVNVYFRKFLIGFEYFSYFSSFNIDDNLSYDSATKQSYYGTFSYEGLSYSALHLGFYF